MNSICNNFSFITKFLSFQPVWVLMGSKWSRGRQSFPSPLASPVSYKKKHRGMGVAGVFPFLKKRKIPYQNFKDLESFAVYLSTLNVRGPVYLDFMACFYPWLTCGLNNQRIVHVTVQKIQHLFNHIPNLNVVFDGNGRSVEKWQTSISRSEFISNKLSTLAQQIDLCNDENFTMSKSKWAWLAKSIKNCRVVDCELVENIKFLLIELQIPITTVPMESDVWIASQQNVHVLSTDSDFLFHPNVIALHRLRINMRSPNLSIITTFRDSLSRKLQISSNKLKLLGIVSMNDYDPNIKGKQLCY
jgi:hypothetical protein